MNRVRSMQKCRVCGCTDEHGCPEGCFWVAEDLCSACFAKSGEIPAGRFEPGVKLIQEGRCPTGQTNPIACMGCLCGHMLECHHPKTCEEAQCSHYQTAVEHAGADEGPFDIRVNWIEQQFASYRNDVMPKEVSETQLVETRRAFFAGVQALVTILRMVELAPEDAGERILQDVDCELQRFVESVTKGAA